MKKLGLILMFALLTIQIAQAQEVTPSPDDALFTYTFETHNYDLYFPGTEWLPDSQSFVVQTILNGVLAQAPLLQYFLPSNSLRSLASPVGQSQLSEEQTQALAVGYAVARTSPNGRYAVYLTNEQVCGSESGCSYLFGLVDLVTNRHATLRRPPDVGNFIRWSADNSALLIMTYQDIGGVGGIWYVDVASALKTSDYPPRLLMNFSIGDAAFVDISRDGRRVLARDLGTGNSTGSGVFLWDSRSPDTGDQFAAFADGRDLLRNDTVAGASFIPGDDRHLLVITRNGLARYDLQTDQLEVLNPAINSQWVTWAYFSPDVRYVLTYDQLDKGSDWQSQIALYPVESED